MIDEELSFFGQEKLIFLLLSGGKAAALVPADWLFAPWHQWRPFRTHCEHISPAAVSVLRIKMIADTSFGGFRNAPCWESWGLCRFSRTSGVPAVNLSIAIQSNRNPADTGSAGFWRFRFAVLEPKAFRHRRRSYAVAIMPFSLARSRIRFCSFSKARTSIWRIRSRLTLY